MIRTSRRRSSPRSSRSAISNTVTNLKRLLILIGAAEALGLAVGVAWGLIGLSAVGGVARLDMTQYGERQLEYGLALLLIPLLTLAAHYTVEWIHDQDQES